MKRTLFALTLSLALAALLTACAHGPAPAEEAPPISAAETGRQDGERFEEKIVILGMEETVRYEHIKNEQLGFEMDYDYENFLRTVDTDRERFVSVWDEPGHPENYLEITSSSQDAETVADSIAAELSEEYDIYRDTRELEHAGSCIRIEADVIKGTNLMPDHLQSVYIIPASDGCRIAWGHSFITESEGFFKRLGYMLNTLMPIDR